MRTMGLNGQSVQQMTGRSRALIIHVVGADGVECSSEELVRRSVGPFVRWLDAALRSGALSLGTHSDIDALLIEFSGPNMPNALIGKDIDLLPQPNPQSKYDESGLVSAKAIFQQREYHELPSYGGDNDANDSVASSADLVIAFNAGIWGYDSWKPTVAHMCTPKANAMTVIISNGKVPPPDSACCKNTSPR